MRVVLLIVDGLSTRWVGAYGNEWLNTPTLDRLAADGLTFDRFTLARPGVGSLVSGRYFANPANAVNATDPANATDSANANDIADTPPTTSATLAFPALARAGVLVHELTSLEPGDLDALAQTLGASSDWLLVAQVENLMPPWQPSDDALAEAFGTDSELQPILGEPPASVDPDDDDTRERLLTTLAAVILDTDAYLGYLFDQLAQCGLLTDTWDGAHLIVTSSGGLALGERGRVGVGGVWSESVHVPLIVRLDQRQQAGLRPQQLAQSVDLLPTLCEWFGVAAPADVQGVSLAGVCRGEPIPLRAYAVSHDPGQPELTATLWTDSETLIVSPGQPEPSYFFKPEDRYEVNDLRQHHLARADALTDLLRRFLDAARQPGPLVPPPLLSEEADPLATDPPTEETDPLATDPPTEETDPPAHDPPTEETDPPAHDPPQTG